MIDQLGVLPEEIMYVGDDALNDVVLHVLWEWKLLYKQENAELEPLEEEVDYIITTIEELLTILSINKQKKEIIKWNYLQEKGGFTLNYNTMGQGYPVVLVHTAFENASIFQNLAHALSKTFQVVLLIYVVMDIQINHDILNSMNLQMILFYY